jgi:3-hydroxyisobutyrate dehydrogenase-like beta-hydroxyacid dehydrogenase
MERVGVIGAGVMGRTIIAELLKAGKAVTVYDAYKPSIEKAVALGANACETPSALAAESDVVLLLLPGPAQIEDCLTGSSCLFSAACGCKIIVDMCTSDPSCTIRMAAKAAEAGAAYLDAPILGRTSTVRKWALPVGGDEKELEKIRKLLNIVAANVIYIGASGSGHKLKLLNQMMFGAINAMTAEMMAVSEKVGIDPALLYNTILASQAGTVSNLFKELGGRVAKDDYSDPTFTVDLLIKDVKLGVQMAKEYNAPPILGRTVELINEMSQAQGYGSEVTSAMWKCVKAVWGKVE